VELRFEIRKGYREGKGRGEGRGKRGDDAQDGWVVIVTIIRIIFVSVLVLRAW
jgi:hypothetical protein